MSSIIFLIKKEGSVSIGTAHYKEIMKLLNNKAEDEFVNNNANKFIKTHYDAGIMLLDFDAKKIINLQNGFGIHNLVKEGKEFVEGFEFIDLTTYY